jgi:mRNA interferase RelE/StbE
VTERSWQLVLAASAERSLARLPTKIAAAVVEFMLGPLSEEPERVGHPLQRELMGLWSARRGTYRILYEIDEQARTIAVVRIDHPADVYRQ